MADNPSASDLILAIKLLADTKNATANIKVLEAELAKLGVTVNATKSGLNSLSNTPSISPKPIKQVNDELDQIPKKTDKAKGGLLSLSNFMRTAFGTLTAIAIFKVGQAISGFFTSTLQAASEFRAAMTELNLAEAILSQKGMEITRNELDGFVKDIEANSKYLSKLDATQVVAETAGAVQEFDVTKEQLKDLADAIAFIQEKNKLLGREEADAAHIINAAMDARSNFFNGMGINITEAIIKERAYAMGLVETGAEIDKATRFQAIMALLTEQTADKQEELNKQLESSPLGKQMAVQKEWADSALEIGQAFITVRDNLVDMLAGWSPELAQRVVKFFVDLSEDVNTFIDSIQEATAAWEIIDQTLQKSHPTLYNINKGFRDITSPLAAAGILVKTLYSGLLGIAAVLATIAAGLITFFAEISVFGVARAFEDAGKNAAAAWKAGWENEFKVWNPSTVSANNAHKNVPLPAWANGEPTAPKDNKPIEIDEDLQKALEKMNNEILEAQLKLAQDMEDAAIDLGRKMEDITIEYAKKRADAERDYATTVADINRDHANKIADINAKQKEARAKAQEDERQREEEHQNKMQELKEKFLMDLEDALHARDARQILKLIKQYELEKTQAERDFALKQEQARRDAELRQKSFADERASAERDRRARLAEAQQDYADKLAKLKADEEAERAAAQLKYDREIQDLEKAMQDRLEIIAANLVAEFNLTAEGLNAIVGLYRKYYSEVSGIYNAMQAMMAGQGAIGTTAPASTATLRNQSSGGGSLRGIRMAEGGTFVADRPTTVTFGEAGLEAASFTPMNRQGADVNKVFSNLGGNGSQGADGQVSIELLLSPDLESRIVSNTLNKTAQVFTKVQRSKR